MSGFISVVWAFNGSGGWVDLCLVWIGIFGFMILKVSLVKIISTRTKSEISQSRGAEIINSPKCSQGPMFPNSNNTRTINKFFHFKTPKDHFC